MNSFIFGPPKVSISIPLAIRLGFVVPFVKQSSTMLQ